MLYQSHSAERLTRLAIVECCPLNSHSSPLEVARCDWTRCRRWSWTTSSSSCRSFSRLPLRLRCIPHVGSPHHYKDISSKLEILMSAHSSTSEFTERCRWIPRKRTSKKNLTACSWKRCRQIAFGGTCRLDLWSRGGQSPTRVRKTRFGWRSGPTLECERDTMGCHL